MFMRDCGVVLDVAFCFLGVSPDRVAFDASSKLQFGLSEIKCPYTEFLAGLGVAEVAISQADFCYIHEWTRCSQTGS